MTQVYFARRASGEGPIKIGCTAHPDQRIKALSSVTGEPVAYLAIAPGDFRDEARLHRQFATDRVEGEWFAPSEAVMRALNHARRTGKLPPPIAEDREIVMAARYLGGETLKAIGDDFEMSRERVRQILRRAGVPSLGHRSAPATPITDFEREVAEAYVAKLASPADLCATYGLTSSQLYIILRRTDTPRYSQGVWLRREDDGERTAEIARLYRAGVKGADIARRFGIPQPTIYVYLRRAGISPSRQACATVDPQVVINAFSAGKTLREIAAQTGVVPVTVRRLLDRHGIIVTSAELERRRVERVRLANARRYAPASRPDTTPITTERAA